MGYPSDNRFSLIITYLAGFVSAMALHWLAELSSRVTHIEQFLNAVTQRG